MPSRIRQEKLGIAAHRALEEQRERTNPLSGAGATPSMGLSQYRGGMKSESESDSDESVGGMVRRHVGGRVKKEAPMSEAMAMGLHLGKHLHSLHGGKFLDEFGSGMAKCVQRGGNASKTGRYEGEGWMDVFNTVRGALPGISSAVGKIGEFIPGAERYTKPIQTGLDVAHTVSEGARKFGYGKKGSLHKVEEQSVNIPTTVMEAIKGGKKKRAPAGPNDGRRKRAEIVKKVMREKGCSMIEASKYVKAHGLY